MTDVILGKRNPMKAILLATLVAASTLSSHAGTVEISNFVATASGTGKRLGGSGSLPFDIQLTDANVSCSRRGHLDALVVTQKGTAMACWRIVGNMVYVTSAINAFLDDFVIPVADFKATDAPFPGGIQWGSR